MLLLLINSFIILTVYHKGSISVLIIPGFFKKRVNFYCISEVISLNVIFMVSVFWVSWR